MTQQTADPDIGTEDPLLKKLYGQFNEERLVKEISAIQLNKIKSLDTLGEEIRSSGRSEEIINVLKENLQEHTTSMVSRYILGYLALKDEGAAAEEVVHLRSIMEDFRTNARWTVVDHIADIILAIEENHRIALRAKVESTERLKGKKELKPYLERLAAIDRKNPDIAKKYALSILEEETDKAVVFLKQAGETYARIKDYKSLEEVWNLIVTHDPADLAFFERIERILVGNREKARVAAYYINLLEPYRSKEDWNPVISILKKILEYEPASTRSRSDLVRAFRARYEGHSLLDDFLKLSDLTNNKKAVGPCIANFERNIVFDMDNYVYHRTRGVGKITSIDETEVIIDFHENIGQRMTIKMAITSLKPLEPDHIWVRFHEHPDEIIELFKEDISLFFETLLSSFGYKMTLAEIKAEVCPRFLTPAEWSKWWSRSRTRLKKEPKFGFNPRKKDELHLREIPMTLSEELVQKFQSTSEWDKKLELAAETLKDGDTEDAAELCVQFYREQEESKDLLKRLHSFFFLKSAQTYLGEDESFSSVKQSEIDEILETLKPEAIVQYCAQTPVVDFKRDLINRVVRIREDYPQILKEILFELPNKVNRYVFAELIRLEREDTLIEFLDEAFRKFRDHPEIFLWSARSILSDQWDYDWIRYGKEEIVLLVFRLLKPLSRFEKKGTRLKNMAVETLFGTTNITVESAKKGILPAIILESDASTVRRMEVIFREVPYIPDAHKENFGALIHELSPGYAGEKEMPEDDMPEVEEVPLLPGADVVWVSPDGYEDRKAYLDKLINVDMAANSKDIGEAQEKGDLRENAEYKAAMERQSQLQAEIKQVDRDLKKARVLHSADVRTDLVTVGCKVDLETAKGGSETFVILGPWEADAKKNIISYLSPLGNALIGKKSGEEASLARGQKYKIRSISAAF